MQELLNPPAFEHHTITLSAKDNSKITGVSVYSGRAEVTRLFKFSLKTGQNQVIINGLPNALDAESLRCVHSLRRALEN